LIQNLDLSAALLDDASRFHFAHCRRDTCAPNPKGLCNASMRERDFTGEQFIRCNEKPPSQSLLQTVTRVTCSELRALDQGGLHVPQQQLLDLDIAPHQLNQSICLDAQGSTGNLNHATVRGNAHAKDQGNADEILCSDSLYLDREAVSGSGRQRGRAIFKKISILQQHITFLQHLSRPQRYFVAEFD
jgi:hypothetical protein